MTTPADPVLSDAELRSLTPERIASLSLHEAERLLEVMKSEQTRLTHAIRNGTCEVALLLGQAVPLVEGLDLYGPGLLERLAAKVQVDQVQLARVLNSSASNTGPLSSRDAEERLRDEFGIALKVLFAANAPVALGDSVERTYADLRVAASRRRVINEQGNRVRRRVVTLREDEDGTQRHRPASRYGESRPLAVPDLDGHCHMPDPLRAGTSTEFVGALRALLVWAGNPSLREVSRRCGGYPTHATLSIMLNGDVIPPRLETVQSFVIALGLRGGDVQAWVTAWRGFMMPIVEDEGVIPRSPTPARRTLRPAVKSQIA